LEFIEKESGARIGMVSTGPDREQTIFMEDFVETFMTREKKAKSKAS
jgi:hypothetical protein